jgi:hypothetical protein
MYVIDYDYILGQKETPAVVRNLIHQVKKNGAVSVGEWVKSQSTLDLISISSAAEMLSSLPSAIKSPIGFLPVEVAHSFIILTDVLSSAEGLEISGVKKTRLRAYLLQSYISMEILKRRGFEFEIFYNNMSLSEDVSDIGSTRPIADGKALAEQMKFHVGSENLSDIGKIAVDKLHSSTKFDSRSDLLKDDLNMTSMPDSDPLVAKVVRFKYDPEKDGPLEDFMQDKIEGLISQYQEELGPGYDVQVGKITKKDSTQNTNLEEPKKKSIWSRLKAWIQG